MNDVRLVKLKSGEELIGDVTIISGKNGGDVIISNPTSVNSSFGFIHNDG